MPARKILSVSITVEQESLIRACIDPGRFGSTSEFVRSALRLLENQERAKQQTYPPDFTYA